MSKPDNGSALFDVMYSCRAMRRLRPDPVPEEVLLQLVDAALQAPSSSNAQNWRFIIVRDRGLKQQIGTLWAKGWGFYRDTIAQADAREGESLEKRARTLRAGSYMVDHMADVPALIFVAIKRDEAVARVLQAPGTLMAAVKHFGVGGAVKLLAGSARANAVGIHSTAYPAVQNLLLAARGLGLGAVLTTPHLFSPGEYETLLGIPKDVTLTAVIPVGYPKGKFGPVVRPSASTVVAWDRHAS